MSLDTTDARSTEQARSPRAPYTGAELGQGRVLPADTGTPIPPADGGIADAVGGRRPLLAGRGGRRAAALLVVESARAVARGDVHGTEALLTELFEHTATAQTPRGPGGSRGDTAARRAGRLFAVALAARLAGDAGGDGNPYLSSSAAAEPGAPALLDAFRVLVRATPFVRFGYEAANAALLRALAGAPRVHIIDVGIGSGWQWRGFLDAVAATGSPPPRVRLTAIDVPSPGKDPQARLHRVGRTLRRRALACGLPFAYAAVAAPVEHLDLDALTKEADEVVAVNACFALHHVPPAPPARRLESRDAVLRRLHALRPRVLTLVEPDTEHHALPFVDRVEEAFGHYSTVFDALAAHVLGPSRARRIIEEAFFGPEILNVVAAEGVRRVERHERRGAWRRRLRRAGFVSVDVSPAARQLERGLHVQFPFAIRADRGMLLLTWKGTAVVAASAWTPANRQP